MDFLARILSNRAAPRADEVTTEELRARLERGDRPVVLDVREPDEWAAGHIPGARHIPLGSLPARLAELQRDEEIVVVCRSGNRSGKAVRWLKANGFTRVYNLKGGLLDWRGPLA